MTYYLVVYKVTFLIDILRNIPRHIKNDNFAIMEFHMLLFFFFFKYSHDLSTNLSKTLLFKASFLFKTSFLFQTLFPFLCKATFFMSLYYSSLRVLRAFKFFFLFLHFVQIS